MVKARAQPTIRSVFESLQKVWKIYPVPESQALWRIGHAAETQFSSESLTLVVWNMCKGVGLSAFEQDFRHLLLQSDLMLVQEALLSRKSLAMICQQHFEATHAASYRRSDELRDGVMTLAKVTPLTSSKRVLCKYSEPVFRTPKAALIQQFPAASGSITVVNVHATLFRSPKRAAEELEHLLEQLPRNNDSTIIAGDFNTISPAFFHKVKTRLAEQGLTHLSIEDDPRPRLQILDHVFYRGLKAVHSEVVIQVKSSDHFPIKVTFDLNV